MFLSYVREVKNALLVRKNLSLVHLDITVHQLLQQELTAQLPTIVLEVLTTISNVSMELTASKTHSEKLFVLQVLLEMETQQMLISIHLAQNVMQLPIQLLIDQENVFPVQLVTYVLEEQQLLILKMKQLISDINVQQDITVLQVQWNLYHVLLEHTIMKKQEKISTLVVNVLQAPTMT